MFCVWTTIGLYALEKQNHGVVHPTNLLETSLMYFLCKKVNADCAKFVVF